jgi:hypothetical protein
MKTNFLKLIAGVLIIIPLSLTSCHDAILDGIEGHGELMESALYLDDFNGFVNAINADIYLSQGDEQKVEIVAQSNIIDNIRLDVENGRWKIAYYHWVHHCKPVKIYITLPVLTSAVISGSGSVYGDTPFEDLDNLSLVISGTGNMEMETESDKLDVLISGSGNFLLSGITGSFDATVTGSGSVDADDLTTPSGDITISGSGSTFVSADEYLHIRILGSGSVYYRGNPQINANITGTGKIRHRQ